MKAFMLKQKLKIRLSIKLLALSFMSAAVLGLGGLAVADQFDQQIRVLQQQNAENKSNSDRLAAEAASYQDAIDKLEAQINGLQQAIVANQQASAALQVEIETAQKELDHQKFVLGQNIKAMYLEGQISTLEILAASRDLSEFVDKQQYRNAVQDQIKTTVAKITALKLELETKQRELQALIAEQEKQRSDLAATQAQQSQMLAYTEGQKAAFDQATKNNNKKIAELRRQQAIENARLFGSSPGTGINCGGGYPGDAAGPWGRWGCNYSLDYNIDNWGMYNRQCVSYTAFRVAASGRNMPYWGGRGNANLWDDNARAAGIPVDGNPREGDVAISNSGYFGHTMYVEAVSEDGSIYISDYNQQWDGRYREYWIPASTVKARSLVFIHFP